MSINKVSLLAAILLGIGMSTSAYAKVDCDDPKHADHPQCQDDGGGGGDVINPADACAEVSTLVGDVVTGILDDGGTAAENIGSEECPPQEPVQEG